MKFHMFLKLALSRKTTFADAPAYKESHEDFPLIFKVGPFLGTPHLQMPPPLRRTFKMLHLFSRVKVQ